MPTQSPAAPTADAQSRATMKDGTSLSYTLHPGGTGSERVVLLHSLAMDREFWTPVIARLTAHAQVLSFDARGHGASGKPPGPYTIEGFADDLAELLDHVGWQSAVVAGASMGGSAALAFAARHGHRAQALGLIDTAPWYGANAAEQWAERAARVQKAGMADLVAFQKSRWFGDEFMAEHPEVVDRCVATFTRNDVHAFSETCHMLGRCDLRSELPRLALPTAVVVGEHDQAAPVAVAQAMHDGIAGSKLTVIKNARHLTPLERPDVIADVLLQLLNQVKQ